jgi:hypothetical protein
MSEQELQEAWKDDGYDVNGWRIVAAADAGSGWDT